MPLPGPVPAAPGGSPGRLPKGRLLIHDRLKLASGRAAFAADLDLPGTLHARIASSPYAAARLVSADASAARALPGVSVVLTALDDEAGALMSPLAQFAGAPWAVVAAEESELAERAAEAIAFHAAPEAARFDVETATVVARLEVSEGDPEAAFARADQVLEDTWRWPFSDLGPLEPPTTLTWLDEDGRLVVRATAGAPFSLRARLAEALALPVSGLRVVRPQVGAPFGPLADPSGAPLAAALTLRTGRPVLLVEESRVVESPPETAHLVHLRAGLREGRLVAASVSLALNLGASASEAEAAAALEDAASSLRRSGSAFHLEARAVLTSLRPLADPRRAAARALHFALEGAFDTAARAEGRSPLHGRAAGAEGALRAAIERALATSASGPAPLRTPEMETRRRGRGLAVAGPWSLADSVASASLTLNQDGSLALRTGALGAPAGVGEALVVRAAAVLGIPAEGISLLPTDTDSAPAEDGGLAEPRLLARAVDDAAAGLPSRPPSAGRRKAAAATSEASVALEKADLPAWSAVVLAEVELDLETGIARPSRLVLAPATALASPLAAWEEGQLAAALPLVFGGTDIAAALDVPIIERVLPPSDDPGRPPSSEPVPVPGLADLLPAAASAFAHALKDASGTDVRALPVRPEQVLGPDGAAVPS